MSRMIIIGGLFLVMGIGLVVLGSMDSVTDAIDSSSTESSDPAGDVLPLIGAIWAAVGAGLIFIPLLARNWQNVFGGRRPSPDDDDDGGLGTTTKALFTLDLSGQRTERLAQLDQMKATGVLDDAEYAKLKAQIDGS